MAGAQRQMTESWRDWNVLTDRWLEAMSHQGGLCVCSPLESLQQSSTIRCLAAASPLDLFAAHRFLLTLLYWKADAAGGVPKLRSSLLRGQMPRSVIDAIRAESACFRLFDARRPFLQDPSARNQEQKSAGSAFAELACGTNIAHFHHGDDAAMRLCLACTTAGILRIVPWSQSGGRGISPSVHNAPPIMAVAAGSNLAVTLGLNLVPLPGKSGKPQWSGHFAPTDSDAPVPYLEAFTWNPRRVHLLDPSTDGFCWRCGRRGVVTVGPIVYAKNDNTKTRKRGTTGVPFEWNDPAAFYNSEDKPHVARKSHGEQWAASGRDLVALVDSREHPPTSVVVAANPGHQDWRLVIPCTNPANNKTYDHRQVEAASLAPDTIRRMLPVDTPTPTRGTDGWTEPTGIGGGKGVTAFVRTALHLLTDADWAVMSAAAYCQMHDSPPAFDLLCGLLWSLRARKVANLPSRNVAWLILKLMAVVPARARVVRRRGGFCPLSVLPKRQIDESRGDRRARSLYPVSLLRGHRLEAALRSALHDHLRIVGPRPIDWAGLCHRLDQLLE